MSIMSGEEPPDYEIGPLHYACVICGFFTMVGLAVAYFTQLGGDYDFAVSTLYATAVFLVLTFFLYVLVQPLYYEGETVAKYTLWIMAALLGAGLFVYFLIQIAEFEKGTESPYEVENETTETATEVGNHQFQVQVQLENFVINKQGAKLQSNHRIYTPYLKTVTMAGSETIIPDAIVCDSLPIENGVVQPFQKCLVDFDFANHIFDCVDVDDSDDGPETETESTTDDDDNGRPDDIGPDGRRLGEVSNRIRRSLQAPTLPTPPATSISPVTTIPPSMVLNGQETSQPQKDLDIDVNPVVVIAGPDDVIDEIIKPPEPGREDSETSDSHSSDLFTTNEDSEPSTETEHETEIFTWPQDGSIVVPGQNDSEPDAEAEAHELGATNPGNCVKVKLELQFNELLLAQTLEASWDYADAFYYNAKAGDNIWNDDNYHQVKDISYNFIYKFDWLERINLQASKEKTMRFARQTEVPIDGMTFMSGGAEHASTINYDMFFATNANHQFIVKQETDTRAASFGELWSGILATTSAVLGLFALCFSNRLPKRYFVFGQQAFWDEQTDTANGAYSRI